MAMNMAYVPKPKESLEPRPKTAMLPTSEKQIKQQPF